MPHLSRRDFTRVLGIAVVGTAIPGCVGQGSSDGTRQATSIPDRDGDWGMEFLPDRMVTMRDGVRLATDIYLPARDSTQPSGPFPVILERTPYGKNRDSRSERSLAYPDRAKSRAEVAEIFARRGYAVVYQDCRGRYGSEGEYQKYLDDPDDGFDACKWILEQDWCDGRIGTMGLSYAAHTQAALACAGTPGLAAMFVDSGGFSNAYQGGIRQGGAFELKQATWAYKNALMSPEVLGDPKLKAAMEEVDIHQWFRDLPWRPGHSPVSLVPAYEAYLFEQWTRGEFDDYWKQAGIFAQGFYDVWPDVPMVHMSSWFDPYTRTATDNYRALSQRKHGPIHLILGPWTHGDRSLSWAGDVDFGPEAPLDGHVARDFWELRVRWFDHWLRGIENGVEDEPRVRYFVMGGGTGMQNSQGRMDHGGHWSHAGDWPIPGTQAVAYYLGPDGSLSPEAPVVDEAQLEYRYDPDDPVPSVGGTITSGEPIMVGGAFNQQEGPQHFGSREPYRPLAERPDILVFQTLPLEADLEITGPLVANLWISSDAPDTDFTAKLVDVYPPNPDYPEGYAMNLTDGILRVRYRDSWEDPSLMTLGEVYAITIEAFPTSNLFQRGHRIRLDISSSNYPHFDLNFNTGEPEGMATRSQVARNRIYMDRSRPSHAVLPVVPR